MQKHLTCIECPNGCSLTVSTDDLGKVVSVEGNQCDKGIKYAHDEMENPQRILTSTVLAKNLSVKMVPVRTDKPIPKDKMPSAMDVVHRSLVTKPVTAGEVIVNNLLDCNVNLIATRSCS